MCDLILTGGPGSNPASESGCLPEVPRLFDILPVWSPPLPHPACVQGAPGHCVCGGTLPTPPPHAIVPSSLEQSLACVSQLPPPFLHQEPAGSGKSPSLFDSFLSDPGLPSGPLLSGPAIRLQRLPEALGSSGRKQGSLTAGDRLQRRKPGFYFCL